MLAQWSSLAQSAAHRIPFSRVRMYVPVAREEEKVKEERLEAPLPLWVCVVGLGPLGGRLAPLLPPLALWCGVDSWPNVF